MSQHFALAVEVLVTKPCVKGTSNDSSLKMMSQSLGNQKQ
jgi:hypothetical protein